MWFSTWFHRTFHSSVYCSMNIRNMGQPQGHHEKFRMEVMSPAA